MSARLLIAAALLALPLSACGEDAPKPTAAKAAPAAFPAGEWEVTALTEKLRSTDNSTPATGLKTGAAETRRICSPAGPKPGAELFAAQGDDCSFDSDYARNGRLNMSLQCTRSGRGPLALSIDGTYDEQTFDVKVVTSTFFSGSGDYSLTQKMTGKRIGDCPAAAG
ncbi:MAG: DUF3617 family protein [Pseudomonadota bacterium]